MGTGFVWCMYVWIFKSDWGLVRYASLHAKESRVIGYPPSPDSLLSPLSLGERSLAEGERERVCVRSSSLFPTVGFDSFFFCLRPALHNAGNTGWSHHNGCGEGYCCPYIWRRCTRWENLVYGEIVTSRPVVNKFSRQREYRPGRGNEKNGCVLECMKSFIPNHFLSVCNNFRSNKLLKRIITDV